MATASLSSGSVLHLNGFGTWKAEPGACAAALRVALDAGYRHIDCAAVYMNEEELGAVFAEYTHGDSPKIPRSELFVTSKVWNTCHGREGVAAGLARTLRDLQLTYLDLYLVHHPFAWAHAGLPIGSETWIKRDPEQPYGIAWGAAGVTLESTWQGMEDAHEAGLVRNVGVSNYNALGLLDLMRYAKRVKPTVHQFECHPMNQRAELRELGEKLGLHSTLYSILGSGKEGPLQNAVVAGIARKHGVEPGAVCIAWGLGTGGSVLSKSVQAKRIAANFAAEKVQLDAEDLAEIAKLDVGLRNCNMVEYWDGFPSHC